MSSSRHSRALCVRSSARSPSLVRQPTVGGAIDERDDASVAFFHIGHIAPWAHSIIDQCVEIVDFMAHSVPAVI